MPFHLKVHGIWFAKPHAPQIQCALLPNTILRVRRRLLASGGSHKGEPSALLRINWVLSELDEPQSDGPNHGSAGSPTQVLSFLTVTAQVQ